MKRAKLSPGKFPFGIILSLVVLVLGFGWTWWSMADICIQLVHYADSYHSSSSSPITSAVKQSILTVDDPVSLELDYSSKDIRNPDKVLYPLYSKEVVELPRR